MDLFDSISNQNTSDVPLAERLRPQEFSKWVGQTDVMGPSSLLQRMLQRNRLQSLILWGPPGSGKTTLAHLIGQQIPSDFISINAVDSGAKVLRELGEQAKNQRRVFQQRTLVFVDEIHRFNKSQQDVLLPYVEKGDFTLIGATTENPSYYLNRALLSRCQILELTAHSSLDLEVLFDRACEELKMKPEEFCEESAKQYLLSYADGDARRMINAVEALSAHWQTSETGTLTKGEIKDLLGQIITQYDRSDDQHYDLISAFIKSVRGSDPDAAIYYLARMIEGGEDPRFISRRLVILASEDIGNADPRALAVAVDVSRAVELIGMPEARINLAQATTYLACAPKSNASYMAIQKAQEIVKRTGTLPVPKALRSARTPEMKKLGYGQGYRYSHEGIRGFVAQDFLPDALRKAETDFYEPTTNGFEKQISEYINWLRKTDKRGRKDG